MEVNPESGDASLTLRTYVTSRLLQNGVQLNGSSAKAEANVEKEIIAPHFGQA